MTPTLLWIVPKPPFPPTDGAKVASFNLVSALARRGITIHLVVISPQEESGYALKDESRKALGVTTVDEILRPGSRSPFSRMASLAPRSVRSASLPLTVVPFAKRAVVERVHELVALYSPEVIVADGLHVAAPLIGENETRVAKTPFVLRAHNYETEIWQRKASTCTNPALRMFFSYQAFCMKRFEHEVVRKSAAIATVSPLDLVSLVPPHLTSEHFSTVVPIGYDFHPPIPPPTLNSTDPLPLLFVGRLDWPPNREGLSWFLKEVWPSLVQGSSKRPYTLTIAGSGNKSWLNEFTSLENVTIKGFVESLDELYHSTCASILPLFYGSGTRVKAIEASRFGRPCVSTALGVEGLGLEPSISYLRAESKDEWITLLRTLSLESLAQIGTNAWSALQKDFENNATASRFLSLVSMIELDKKGGSHLSNLSQV
jgi:polysaccharide biosynthesis protein PslH